MKRFLTAVALLLCSATLTLAGPNAGGTLFLHDPGISFTTDTADYCGLGTPPASCEAADVNITGATNAVWKVYAAFPPNATPRLKAVAFGITYDEDTSDGIGIVLTGQGGCDVQLEVPDATWPASDTGTSVVFNFVKETALTEVYWFAGYAYNNAATVFTLRTNPSQGGNFADDSVPSILDEITGYGSMGFEQEGLVACPTALTDGACCHPDGTCTVTDQAGCTDSWQGVGTTCDPNPCPQPQGACCKEGVCTVVTESECTLAGGTWQGTNVGCDPNPCPQPTLAACCGPLGECLVKSQYECDQLGWVWHSDISSCDPNPCPIPPTGACCYAATCVVQNQYECTTGGGEFLGPDSVCDPNPCPVVPVKPMSWGRVKAQYR